MVDALPLRILLVEDNAIDARAIMRAINKLPTRHSIDLCEDGAAAIDFLTQEESDQPDLILLDLNLPGLDGHDVLAKIKSDPSLKRIPVVILTTSSTDTDVLSAYDQGANAYVNKPMTLDGWQDVIDQIEGFWLSLVRLPRSS